MDALGSVYLGREGSGNAQVFRTGGFTQATGQYLSKVEKEVDEFKAYQRLGEQQLMENLDLAVDGFASDLSTVIYDGLTEFQNEAIAQFEAGINVGRVDDIKSYQKLQKLKQNVLLKSAQSTAQKQQYAQLMSTLADPKAADKLLLDETAKKQLEEWRGLSIEERAKVDPNSFIVPKIDTLKYAKDLVGTIDQFEGSIESTGSVGRDLVSYNKVEQQNKEAVISAFNETFDNDPVLQRNMNYDREAWLSMGKSMIKRKETPGVSRQASPKDGTGSSPDAPYSPGSPKTVGNTFNNVTTTSGVSIEGSLGSNPKGIPISPNKGAKKITVFDSASQQNVTMKPTFILKGEDGLFYAVGQLDEFNSTRTDKSGVSTQLMDKESDKESTTSVSESGGTTMATANDDVSTTKGKTKEFSSSQSVSDATTKQSKSKSNTFAVQITPAIEESVLMQLGFDASKTLNQYFGTTEEVTKGDPIWDKVATTE